MKVRNAGKREDKIELQMTPMIDIVFQLLVFFIMTFKIVVPEGDFNIKMPLQGPVTQVVEEPQLPPIKLRLRSGANGDLAGIQINDQSMGKFIDVRNRIISIVGNDPSAAESAEVEIDVDYDLKYENVIHAITAVSGYRGPDGKIVKLVEKIKFAPPKKAGVG